MNASIWVLTLAVLAGSPGEDELRVGAATVSITPKLPVGLTGQMRIRIAKTVESEVTAPALALESGDGSKAILVSCDLVSIRGGIIEKVRRRLQERLPDFDSDKIIISATHTHTAPIMMEGRYNLPKEGVTQPAEYVEFLSDRVAEAAVAAWNSRKPCRVGWGTGHAVVALNRRSVYADGTARMYGSTSKSDFRRIEGPEDHSVEVLFFWNAEDTLIATAVNVACPSQEVEGRSAVNADFWHEVRLELRKRHGESLHVLGWTGAAGDQSPHLMFRKAAEERMRKLRGLTRLQELARRIVRAWEDAYEGARRDKRNAVPLTHEVRRINLPVREVTDAEYENASRQAKKYADDPKNKWRARWYGNVVKRYEAQKAGEAKPYEMELHVIRLGDIAIATNDFELYTDFGIQMKARSKALQTFIIQLAGAGSYVPTRVAVEGGGYSAIVESSVVGPKGGQELVEKTVKLINFLWR